jgi:hypothetical protein
MHAHKFIMAIHVHIYSTIIKSVIAVLEDGGFTYHRNRVPSVSRVMINPVQDSDLSVELTLVAINLKLCPLTVVRNNNNNK